MDNKLSQLIYRKEVIEFTLQKFHNGAKINMELCDVIKDKITKDDYASNYEYWKLKSELIEVEIVAQNYITSYKNTLREYKDFIIPEIQKSDFPLEAYDFWIVWVKNPNILQEKSRQVWKERGER